jgi:transposase
MAIAMHQISPVAHLPLVLGVIRKLNLAALIDTFCPPHPANVLACGRGVEALLLAIVGGYHAPYKVGARLEERGMLPLLQPGLMHTPLHDYRLGQILDALFAANLNRVFGSIALHALEVYAIPTPWLHQDATTVTLYGAYEEEPHRSEGPVPPRSAYGHSKDGHDDLKQVLLSLGVSNEGLPLRMGLREGNTSDSTETPVAIEECMALGLYAVRGIVADSKAYCKRTLGLCLEQRGGLVTPVPRTCEVRQELEAWGQQHSPLPLLLEKPGRTRQEPPRRWHGQSVRRGGAQAAALALPSPPLVDRSGPATAETPAARPPPKTELPQDTIRYHLRVEAQAHVPSADTQGRTVLATTVEAESCTDTEILQPYPEQHITVEPGFRWIKNPAAISPVWLEKPERVAALAMPTVVGLLVYAVIQRQVRLYLRNHNQQVPGNKGPTATPTAAVVFILFAPVMRVQFVMEEQISFQIHGLEPHHLLICGAVGLDPTWYGVPAIQQIYSPGPHPLEPGLLGDFDLIHDPRR